MRLLGAVFVLVVTCNANDYTAKLQKQFKSFFLVPYVISIVPPAKLSVRWPLAEADLGNKIAAYYAAGPPFIYYDAVPGDLYTILFVDPDVPSGVAPLDAQFLHACIVNIPGNNLERGNYLTSYYPPSPAPGSQPHRYLILLFRQLKRIDITNPYLANLHKNRYDFSAKAFAVQYGLGEPIAGNFFLAQHIMCDCDPDTVILCNL